MKGEVSYFMSTRNSPYKLDMLVLSTLSKHDCYGYQLTQIFDECSNGIIKPKVSSLYPILYRLIDQGYISSYEEIIYVFLTIFLYLLKCPQSLIL